MRQKRIAALLTACLLSGFMVKAQNTVVEGAKLNIGEGNTVSCIGSGALGHSNIVGAINSFAVGYCDTIDAQSANNSFTLGTSNRIGGCSSFGFGQDVKVSWAYGLGLGRYLKATGEADCMIIGSGFCSLGLKPKLYFENQYDHSLMIGFHSTRPTLTIGPSPNDYPYGDTLSKTGKIAIGDVPIPEIGAKLHIRSDYGEDAGIILESKDSETANSFIRLRDEDHGIEVDNLKRMRIKSMDGNQKMPVLIDGIVGINLGNVYCNYLSPNARYALYVHGGIITDKVAIKHYGLSWWPDYVFYPEYHLLPLKDLQTYINDNHHLPDVPSEAEVMENGIELGNIQGLLLKKIEETTLYLLQQQEIIEQLEQRIAELEGKQ